MPYLPWLFFSLQRSVTSRWFPAVMPTRRFLADVVAAYAAELELYCVTLSALPHTNIVDCKVADFTTAAEPSCASGRTIWTLGLPLMLPTACPPWLWPLTPIRDMSTELPRNERSPVLPVSAAISASTSRD